MNNRLRIQVSFDPETEPDIVAFMNEFKKTERHCVFQSALRQFMTGTGFYQRGVFDRGAMIKKEEVLSGKPETIPEKEEPMGDYKGENDIIHMFDDYQQ